MSQLHEPCCFIRPFYINPKDIAWKIRRKMSLINSKMIELNKVSGMLYYLYIDHDMVMLLNATYNKVLFTIPVSESFAVLNFKLNQIIEMHNLEHKPFTTIYEKNHYYSLKKQFAYE